MLEKRPKRATMRVPVTGGGEGGDFEGADLMVISREAYENVRKLSLERRIQVRVWG